ncbi:MAG: Crp/Fnr family transcriptional regulator [Flavobacteriaceae bacterium]
MIKVPDYLAHLNPNLLDSIRRTAILKELPKNTEILREGQYIKVIPLVLKGLIKVFTRYKDRELLLYYIQPRESCIMSFSASLGNDPSSIYAVAEEDTEALLLPVREVQQWIVDYPGMNRLFFQQYKQRYSELLDTIHHVMFDKMDKRLYDHLRTKATVKKENPIAISHQQLADELGTVREVISRVMKKLETEELVKQLSNRIEIL